MPNIVSYIYMLQVILVITRELSLVQQVIIGKYVILQINKGHM